MNKREQLTRDILDFARKCGFQQAGVADIDLSQAEQEYEAWIDSGFQGDMQYMKRHGKKRTQPDQLVPGTRSIISVRMDYLPELASDPALRLQQAEQALISNYALGRDYHKTLRQRLKKLGQYIDSIHPDAQTRVLVDSAPVLEKPLAVQAGIGWQGKHTNLIHPKAGSWFFLGEIYTNLDLDTAVLPPVKNHCGQCQRCMDICPTQAIIAPYKLDARLCISYLTIEHHGPIPVHLRPLIGNHVYGCDDCQTVCPWNRFAQYTKEEDFLPRHQLDQSDLLSLFAWDEALFLKNMEGSAIRRIGFERWQRNLSVCMGNALSTCEDPHLNQLMTTALSQSLGNASELVREHIQWALEQS